MDLAIYLEYGMVCVRLSRRNILTLLSQVEHPIPGKERTLGRTVESGWTLVVVPEPDEEHYGERRPGQMDTWIEQEIAAYQAAHPKSDADEEGGS